MAATDAGVLKMEERIREIDICDIRPFGGSYGKGYFHISRAKVDELEESIREAGILEPLILRLDPTGQAKYELIAGRTRMTAAGQAGLKKVPCLIKNLNDAEAIYLYGESNRYRDDITVIEKAYMLRYAREFEETKKMKNGEIRRNAIFDEIEDRDCRRYIRLTYLIPPLQDMVNSRRISIEAGVEASYLPEELQSEIYFNLNGSRKVLTVTMLRNIRKTYENEIRPFGRKMNATEIDDLLCQKRVGKIKLSIPAELLKQLPPEFETKTEQEKLIEKLLQKYLTNQKT